MMIDKKQVTKMVKAAARKSLFVQEYKGDYLLSNTHWLLLIRREHTKVLQEVAKAFTELPVEGQAMAIDFVSGRDPVDLAGFYERFKDKAPQDTLTVTDFIMDGSPQKRILVGDGFTTMIDERYYQMIRFANLKGDSRYEAVFVYSGEHFQGVILPIWGEAHDPLYQMFKGLYEEACETGDVCNG